MPRRLAGNTVIERAQLLRMSPEERQGLLRELVAMDGAGRDELTDQSASRRRAIALVVIITACLVLAAWIGVLAVTLPRYYRSGDWRGAWVGFDLALLGVFLVTGWAAWRRRQVLIICLIVLATLLLCDAWFDVVLDERTAGFWVSLLSALVIELPMAGIAILGARRLLRLNIAALRRYEGVPGPPPRLRDVGLLGGSPGWRLVDHLFADAPEAAGAAGARLPDGGHDSPRDGPA